jgi:hypothetical protein
LITSAPSITLYLSQSWSAISISMLTYFGSTKRRLSSPSNALMIFFISTIQAGMHYDN